MIELKDVERSYKTGPAETWVLRRIETVCRRPQRNLLAVVAFILAACLPVVLCFAASPNGKTKKVAPAPAPLAPGAYFGLKLPGETPELFAPGIVNIPGRNVGHLAFSLDATECYLSVFDGVWTNNRILFTRYDNGAWTPQALVTFADGRQEGEPLFSRDGNRLYFTAQNTSGGRFDRDFFMVQRASRGEEWSKPEPLTAPLNSPKDEWSLTQTADGTMYFASDRDGGHGEIYRTVSKPGQPLQVEKLGQPVNSGFDDQDPGISPDGHTLIFFSKSNRPGVTNNATDLFICFDNGHGGWTTPVEMGEGFNTLADIEYAPTFSPDGRVLFFARFDGKHSDVYWVSTTALERFRKITH
jgi:Tol biopolymer transport system component